MTSLADHINLWFMRFGSLVMISIKDRWLEWKLDPHFSGSALKLIR